MNADTRLAGKVAIVTGAAQGIGAVYARALAAAGAAVSLCDLHEPHAVVAEIVAAGGRAQGSVVDVTDAAAVRSLVEATGAAFGGLDILVNNAALFGGLARQPFLEIRSEEWDRVMSINTRGVFECARAAVPAMRARGGGKIINISSSTVLTGTPMLLHYVASKGAVIAMTRAMARELGEHNIAVNCLAPGLTMSEAVKSGPFAVNAPMALQMRAFKRDQQPEDLVGPLLFLACADSDFVTGQTYVVDGGGFMQ
jgi:NAD(P)-dependent dehydrogenase (short-subunit alcohol dehydrogenase family)